MKNNKAFTLLEMLMVMFIISLLLLLTIPNITSQKDNLDETGCEAYADMVQTQVTAYDLANGNPPSSLNVLVSEGYIPSTTCADESTLVLSGSDVRVQ